MDTPKFSIITIVNNQKKFADFKKSLSSQIKIDYELLKIDNCHQEYQSAREAYNSGAQKAKGKFLIFCHPDIRFLDPLALHNITNYLSKISAAGVVGIAGTPFKLINKNRIILSTIVHGDPPFPVGKKISKPTKVQTVDECFFILSKSFWKLHPFSVEKGWHLYAVEECLLANSQGFENYVVPAHIWHTSNGKSENYQYYIHLKHLVKNYQKQVSRINTTVKMWPTRGIKSHLYINYWLINRWLKQILHLKIK